MRFYLNENSNVPINTFMINSILEVIPIDTLNRPSFRLQLIDNQIRQFGCNSNEDRERWICALSETSPVEKVTINSFRIGQAIGKGAFGTVYLVRQKSNGAIFAMKAISKGQVKSEARKSHIIAERNILMRASHQFITKIYYAFQTSTEFYFVLEYVGGGDLKSHLERGIQFSRNQIQLYLAEITIALKTLHKLGVIYRDLKPENILLDINGHIKLADFGLSRLVDKERPNCFSFCGTYEYISPEMLKDEPQTFCVDWWAFGILAFLLLTGYLPYKSLNRRRLFDMIMNKPLKCPAFLDSIATSFLQQLLQKDPTKRLGASGNDIINHPFFEGICWQKVAKMEYEPMFKPHTSHSTFEFDLKNTFQSDNTIQDPDSLVSIPGFSFQTDLTVTQAVSYDDLTSI